MNRDNTPWRPLAAARLAWDDAGNPRSEDFSDIYYSSADGLAESRHVFLAGNALPGRWRDHGDPCFTIGETGFGSGLNFLAAWQAWRDTPRPKPDLHYIAVERHPLQRADLRRALASWPALSALAQALAGAYPPLVPGQHRLCLDGGRVRLDLWFEDAADALRDLASHGRPRVDAWFLDGFAPARNPQMWSAGLCADIGRLTRAGGTFATFTAAGQVRRDLQAAGFDVSKSPGFGRKRERLVGRRSATAPVTADASETPWDLPRDPGERPGSALVLGAGLAGCAVAHALARRGIEVTVLERGRIAGGGSGNEQGILYTRLSRRHSVLTDFALQSYSHAVSHYRAMFDQRLLVPGRDGELCGNLQLVADEEELAALAPLLAQVEELASVVSRRAASERCGQDVPSGGFWLPGSGWLHPPAVCRALLQHPGIHVAEHCGDLGLRREDGLWRAVAGDSVIATADCAVVAAGTGCPALPGLDWLPLRRIRGQTTLLPGAALPGQLRSTVCDEGYIAPARDAQHCIGASFVLDFDDLELKPCEHRGNLERIARMLPAWREALAAVDVRALRGRVGVRCASPDYLPLAGPVPDVAAFTAQYAALRRNAKRAIGEPGAYVPGLFLSAAHGSRGLTSTPLLAELLASQICAEAPPLSRELARAVAPARFIIRDLGRNRI